MDMVIWSKMTKQSVQTRIVQLKKVFFPSILTQSAAFCYSDFFITLYFVNKRTHKT